MGKKQYQKNHVGSFELGYLHNSSLQGAAAQRRALVFGVCLTLTLNRPLGPSSQK